MLAVRSWYVTTTALGGKPFHMQRLFCIAFLILSVTSLSFAEDNLPVTTGLTVRYSVYATSVDSVVTDSIGTSFIQFRLKAGAGPVYEYHLEGREAIRGIVESYNETDTERQYVLGRFFNGRYNATLRIVDLPDCDNLKAAVIYYTNQSEDPETTYLQYILALPM